MSPAGAASGKGPNAPRGQARHGAVSIVALPAGSELAAATDFVLDANGLRPRPQADGPLPAGIKHVILIVKENRTYDEVFGDIPGAMGMPEIARFGSRGYVDGERKRLSIKDIDVTPNHHALARQWAISDNFYADSDVSVDGHHWLVGSYPNAWTESSLMAAYSDQKKDFRLGCGAGPTALRRLRLFGSSRRATRERHHLAPSGSSPYYLSQFRRGI